MYYYVTEMTLKEVEKVVLMNEVCETHKGIIFIAVYKEHTREISHVLRKN